MIKHKPATNTQLRAANIVMSFISIFLLILIAVPIITTIIQAQHADDHNAAGMVVFSVILLAPFWGIALTGWLAFVPLILSIIGGNAAQWKIQRREYSLLVASALMVIIALWMARNIPMILPFYHQWFFLWLS